MCTTSRAGITKKNSKSRMEMDDIRFMGHLCMNKKQKRQTEKQTTTARNWGSYKFIQMLIYARMFAGI